MTIEIMALRDCQLRLAEYLYQLAHWHHHEWLHLNPGATLHKRLERYQQSTAADTLPEIFIAIKNKQLLGSVTLDKEDMDTRKQLTPWLASLFVKPEFRGQGIATRLIKFCTQYAQQRGFKNVYLFTEDQTEFYKQRGFRFIETLEYRNAEVDLMSHRLINKITSPI